MDTACFQTALHKIDALHAEDPRLTTIPNPEHQSAPSSDNGNDNGSGETPQTIQIPYELHYANKMTKYLRLHSPSLFHPTPTPTEPKPPTQSASAPEAHIPTPDIPLLYLAIRAQHLQRWTIPRASYPATKPGYLNWRKALQRTQAELAEKVCTEAGYTAEEAGRVGALVRKEGLKEGDPCAQVLEDVACLVFLDDQLEGFVGGYVDDQVKAKGDGSAEGAAEEKIVGILRKTWGKMSERGRELALGIEMGGKGGELVRRALG